MLMPTKDSRDSLILPRRLSRRSALKGAGALGLAAGAGIPFSRLTFAQDAGEELREGGHLKVAIVGEPPAVLDSVFSTATVTNNLSQQVFEGLFTFDSAFNPQPMLVEDYSMSEDGLTYTFKLRSGIRFHDGSEVVADDVVASLNRWGTLNGRGKLILNRMTSMTAPDPETVVMEFEAPTGVLLSFLARAEAFIVPAAIAEAAGESQLGEDQFIGTGPFRFVEHAVDQYIRVERFDDYTPREEEPDGLAGRRIAYVDMIDFIPVPDESVRANGVLSGEYHFGDPLPPDFYDMLDGDPSVIPIVVKPYYWYAPVFNKKEGLFTNQAMRQAVQAVFDPNEALIAGFGNRDLVRADPSICGEETAWYSTAGTEVYGQADPERAQALLEEGGYNGETIRWITTHEYAYNFKFADYIKQQMEAIGMTVELIVSDWATLVQNRSDPTAQEIFLTGFSQYAHPATQPFNDAAWPGFWESERKDEILSAMVEASDPDVLQSAIDSYTELIYDEMPLAKIGDNFVLRAHREEMKGYGDMPDWFFWNVGLE
jgi:peptide/nickel transport system substrate-binding protein